MKQQERPLFREKRATEVPRERRESKVSRMEMPSSKHATHPVLQCFSSSLSLSLSFPVTLTHQSDTMRAHFLTHGCGSLARLRVRVSCSCRITLTQACWGPAFESSCRGRQANQPQPPRLSGMTAEREGSHLSVSSGSRRGESEGGGL